MLRIGCFVVESKPSRARTRSIFSSRPIGIGDSLPENEAIGKVGGWLAISPLSGDKTDGDVVTEALHPSNR